jgi:hypothetical protein
MLRRAVFEERRVFKFHLFAGFYVEFMKNFRFKRVQLKFGVKSEVSLDRENFHNVYYRKP